MIEALSLWLQKIILVVLIATFLDMLLPNSGMQRYVRLVMGLLILLTIISPVLEVIKKDLTSDKIAMRIMKLTSGSTGEDWEQIKDYSEKLMQQNEQETQDFVRSQLEGLIQAKVEEDYGIRVSSIKVDMAKEKYKQQEYPVISSVQLILDKDLKASRQEDGGNLRIQPIEPVTISVAGESSQKASTVSTSSGLSAAEQKLLNEIANDIAKTWSIDRSQIVAKVEGKQEEG
ncbi:stage III sporulation protein AF [Ammoniphilus sp. CFH 90114]|uniref:stage III sporulation protein AF n=1 Tax=Ammoniphilus sp. CFH 90114 TaxID=2493665 RepID=UPI00100F723D|nr:stage III sporulation protein AF [Ammoniphilus sp. CFH 90114]RXT13780.1 stage III sporulation protein AF [Ammoniphilus sp. CFH 90114]